MSTTKRCYYDVLNIAQSATAAEIKTAYRRLALEYHPDKNPTPAAEQMFKTIVEAYETLSDEKERAWYDSHKNAVLYGDDAAAEDAESWLFPYFRSDCFSGVHDATGGFFAVFRNVFDNVRANEPKGGKNTPPLPSFGTSQTDSDDVLRFYECWREFTSRQSFAWCDTYPEHQATCRYERRAMAQENSAIRAHKKKSYTMTVRLLVKHVQSHDPRFGAALLRRRAAREDKQRQAAARQAEKRRAELERLRASAQEEISSESDSEKENLYVELLWGQMAQTRKPGDGAKKSAPADRAAAVLEALSELDIEAEEQPVGFPCQPCGKTFQTEKELGAHMKTSKHRQAVKALGI